MRRSSLALGIIILTAACSRTAAQTSKQPAPTDVVATVGSTSITLAQVDERALQIPVSNFGSLTLSGALYEARRTSLEEMVGNVLIDQDAKARGTDRATLVEQEITSKTAPVTDEDVSAWYRANQSRVQGATLDQVRVPIRSLLTQERLQTARQQFVDRLRAKTAVRVLLDPPRQAVKMVSTSPTRGPANAPIEMIDFSDFQ